MELTCHTSYLVFLSFRGQEDTLILYEALTDAGIRGNKNRGITDNSDASVTSLTIKPCSSLQRLSDFSKLRNITKLTLHKCEKLKEIQGLEDLESVKHLVIRGCRSLEKLPNLSSLGLLKRLHIEKCKKLKEIDGIESGFLRYLHIGYCNSLERVGINTLEMNRLEYVCIEFCNSLREIHSVSPLLKNSPEVKQPDMGSITLTSLAEQDSDSNSEAAAKAVLKRFFAGGIETLASSVDLVPVVAASKALIQRSNGDHFWDDFSYKLDEASSSYKLIHERFEAAERARAKYAKLKEFAVELRNDYHSVRARIIELEKTVSDQELQIASLERQVLVSKMKEQVGVMRATQEEIQYRDAECDASNLQLNLLKAQWDSWAAHLA